jgi:hypothetical protein
MRCGTSLYLDWFRENTTIAILADSEKSGQTRDVKNWLLAPSAQVPA